MNTCPKCGKEIKANEKFCTSCGTPIVRCPKCGTPYLPGRKFCTACGAPLQAEDTPGMGKVRQTNVSPGGAAVSGQHKRNPRYQANQVPVPPVPPPNVQPAKKHSLTAILLAAVLIVGIGGGAVYYKTILEPQKKIEQEILANETKKKTAQEQTAKQEEVVSRIYELSSRKNEFDSRLTNAANTINGGDPGGAEQPLKDLNKDIDAALADLNKLKGNQETQKVIDELRQLFQYERQRSDGMLRGIQGDRAGYKDGGDAYDAYHELNGRFENDLRSLPKK